MLKGRRFCIIGCLVMLTVLFRSIRLPLEAGLVVGILLGFGVSSTVQAILLTRLADWLLSGASDLASATCEASSSYPSALGIWRALVGDEAKFLGLCRLCSVVDGRAHDTLLDQEHA